MAVSEEHTTNLTFRKYEEGDYEWHDFKKTFLMQITRTSAPLMFIVRRRARVVAPRARISAAGCRLFVA